MMSQTWETGTPSEPNGYTSGYFGPPEERSVIDPGAPANLFNCPIKCLWKVWVFWTTGGKISDRSWGAGEFVQLSHQVSLESVGLLVSDPALVVLVEVTPRWIEVGVGVGWDFVWLELVSGLQDGTSSELSIILHEELLTGLVSRWSETLSSVSGENIVHDLVLISTIIS